MMDVDNDTALVWIREHMENDLLKPNDDWDDSIFLFYTYSRFSAEEIYDRIAEEAMILPYPVSNEIQRTPLEIINEFIDELDAYHEEATSRSAQKMFEYAKYEALDILDILYS